MNVADLFASFGVKVDTRTFLAASDAVRQLEADTKRATASAHLQAAIEHRIGNTGKALDLIGLNVEKAQDGMRKAAAGTRNWGQAIIVLNQALGIAMKMWAGLQRVMSLGAIADEYTGASSKIRGLTDDVEQQARLQDQLFASAQDTASGYGDVVSLYAQVAKSAQASGRTLEQAAVITDTINKAIKSSGASSSGAAAALQQLSQGLGSGTLRGEEFNSVIEQAPVLIDIIAQSMGKTRGEMRKLAEGGKITAESVYKALENARGSVDDAFAKRIPQVGDLFVRLRNSAAKSLSEVFQRKDVMDGLTALFDGLAAAMSVVVQIFGVLASAGATMINFYRSHSALLVGLLTALAAAFTFMGVSAAIAWIAALGPVGLIALAIAVLIALMPLIVKGVETAGRGIMRALEWIGDKFQVLGRGIKGVFRSIGEFFAGIARTIRDAWGAVLDWIESRIQDVKDMAAAIADWIREHIPFADRVLGSKAARADATATTPPQVIPSSQTARIEHRAEVNINAPSADTEQVKTAVRAVFQPLWDAEMRQAAEGIG